MVAGRAVRLSVLSVWSMSVRRRRKVWEKYRRSPYCYSLLLWQGGSDQAGGGLAVGEDLGDIGSALDLTVELLDGVAAAGSWPAAP